MQNITPGIWYLWHKLSLEAIDNDSISSYIWMVKTTVYTFECECREHAIEYIENNPPENYLHFFDSNGIPYGMFLWSFLFHNAVNKRLNKKQLDFDSALKLYLPKGEHVCSAE